MEQAGDGGNAIGFKTVGLSGHAIGIRYGNDRFGRIEDSGPGIRHREAIGGQVDRAAFDWGQEVEAGTGVCRD